VFDSKIPAAVCLSTKKSEMMKETNRTGPRIVRDIIDSTSGEEVEDAGLVDMMVHFRSIQSRSAISADTDVAEASVTNISHVGMGRD